jgi:hypothetical protein
VRPAVRAGHGGKLGINCDVFRTACGRLVRKHWSKLIVGRCCDRLPQLVRYSFVMVCAEGKQRVRCKQTTRQLVVPVFTPMAYTLLQSRCEFLVLSALRLRPTLCASFPFTWVIEDCAIRTSEQIRETRIESHRSVCSALDGIRLRVNEQAELPTRCTLDDATALNLPLGNVLLAETNAPQPRGS